jgi:hypothetical protein
MSDDEVVSIALPFSFSYFGVNYDTVYLSSNGYVLFDPTYYNSYVAEGMAANEYPWNIIAVFWKDLLSGDYDISYGTFSGQGPEGACSAGTSSESAQLLCEQSTLSLC